MHHHSMEGIVRGAAAARSSQIWSHKHDRRPSFYKRRSCVVN